MQVIYLFIQKLKKFKNYCRNLSNLLTFLLFQNPNEDTEWNDILRAKGILPPKKEKEITEEDVINLVEQTVREKQNGNIRMN